MTDYFTILIINSIKKSTSTHLLSLLSDLVAHRASVRVHNILQHANVLAARHAPKRTVLSLAPQRKRQQRDND